MSLDNLTTSGWVLLIWTCIVALGLMRYTLLVVSLKNDAARIIIAKQMGASGLLLVIQLLWLRWLVAP